MATRTRPRMSATIIWMRAGRLMWASSASKSARDPRGSLGGTVAREALGRAGPSGVTDGGAGSATRAHQLGSTSERTFIPGSYRAMDATRSSPSGSMPCT